MRIAVVGSGISGLMAARLLHDKHDITVFEERGESGGHAQTHTVEVDGRELAVDTGFVLFNETVYPRFSALLEALDVEARPCDMTFGLKCERTGLEYSCSSLNTLFLQRNPFLSQPFLNIVWDAMRFTRMSRAILESGDGKGTLDQVLEEGRYSRPFIDRCIVPMASSIWSIAPERALDFPALTFLRFFDNHGLIPLAMRPAWKTIRGGARNYVHALIRPFRDRIRLNTPVRSVRRLPDSVEVTPKDSSPERFDLLILAVHGDRALEILENPSDAEREILGAIPFLPHSATLHTDTAILPEKTLAWAGWNYLIPDAPPDGGVILTYNMNRLQGLDSMEPLLLTLNREDRIRPEKILRRFVYRLPVFTRESMEAQGRLDEISGVDRTYYCGAYWRYGFHEDAVRSAEEAVRRIPA